MIAFRILVDDGDVDVFAAAGVMTQIQLLLEPLDGVEVREVSDPTGRPRGAVQELLIVAAGTGAAYHALRHAQNAARRLSVRLSIAVDPGGDAAGAEAAHAVLRGLEQSDGSQS